MANLGDFDANQYENYYAPMPAGEYEAVITGSEMKASNKGGEYLKLTVDIVSGQYKGRKVFANLNLKNANPEAERIAKTTLADICRAVGVLHPRDSSELHGKPIIVELSVRPETADFPASNDVKGWKAMGAAVGTQSNPIQMPTAGKKPWEK